MPEESAEPLSLEPLKILVLRYRFLGDTILTVPFLDRLRQAFPNARINVLVAPQSGVLLENCPYIDELIEFDTTRFHKYDLKRTPARSFWGYIGELKVREFDRAYLLKRSFSSALLAWLAGIPVRIGFDTECRGWLLTERVKFDPGIHEAQNYLNHLPSPFSESYPKSEKLFWPNLSELARAQSLIDKLSLDRPKILIHAPAAHPLKLWTLAGWSRLCQLLKEKKYQIIFSGSATDQPYYAALLSEGAPQPDLDLTLGELTLRENITLYSFCDAAISVDSGPMHLAAAVGLPVIGIFGPSDPRRWQPWSDQSAIITAGIQLDCRPCLMKPVCTDRECLSKLEADEVLAELERLLPVSR